MFVRFAMFHQRRVHLTRAEDDTLNIFVLGDITSLVGWIGDDPLEVRVIGELIEVGACKWMSKERFGEEYYESCSPLAFVTNKKSKAVLTFSELSVHLPSEDVEQV